MARTRFYGRLRRALSAAHLARQGEPFSDLATAKVSRRAVIAGIAATAATGPLASGPGRARTNAGPPRVAIVGAGLAGLSAACHLGEAGLRADVYEGLGRVGGRVYTSRRALGPDMFVDLGGELVNRDHRDLRRLAERFGLGLFHRHEDFARRRGAPVEAFLFQGKRLDEAALAGMLGPLADRIGADAAALDTDYDAHAPRIDTRSVAQYLDDGPDLPAPARAMVEAAIRSEFGVEPHESSALQLLFNLPAVAGGRVDPVSGSDESYAFSEGSGSLTEAMAAHLGERVHRSRVLARVSALENGNYRLEFVDGAAVEADYAILTCSPPALRRIAFDVPLPRPIARSIARGMLGRNEKIVARFRGRPWAEAGVFLGEVWADEGFAVAWDASQRLGERADGALNFFLGGELVAGAAGEAADEARRFAPMLDGAVPGIVDRLTGAFVRTRWSEEPLIGGGYASFRPGELTSDEYIAWVEKGGAVSASVRADNLLFAGEYWSEAFYGFMNGAAETGRLAAKTIADEMA